MIRLVCKREALTSHDASALLTLQAHCSFCAFAPHAGIAFLLPCAFALKVEDEPWGGRPLAWVVMICGTIVGAVTTVATVVYLVID